MMRRFTWIIALLWLVSFSVVAQDSTCPGAPAPRLVVGEQGRVLPGQANNVRDLPSTSGGRVGQIPSEGVFAVLEGPTCADGFNWWRVDYDGMVGWTVEGQGEEYWVEPLPAVDEPAETPVPTPTLAPEPEVYADPIPYDQPLAIGGQARVNTTGDESLRLRSTPGTSGEIVMRLPAGTVVNVLDGPQTVDGFIWWQVETEDGVQGWTIEGLVSEGVVEQTLFPLCPYTTGRIAFVWVEFDPEDESMRPDFVANIFTIDPDGSNPCNLTGFTSENEDLEQLAWSSDGSQLAFVNGGNIYMINPDGSNMRRVTQQPGTYASLSWSPDSSQITYVVRRLDRTYEQIWAMNADGSNPYALTTSETIKHLADWSGDGTQIAYVETSWGEPSDYLDDKSIVYVIGSRGGAPAAVGAEDLPGVIFSIDWSPVEPVLAVCSGQNLYHCDAVFLVDTVTNTVTTATEPDQQVGVEAPTWSPDGSMIAYWGNVGLADHNGEFSGKLMVVNADGSNPRELDSGLVRPNSEWLGIGIRPEGVYTKISWSPDGAYITYTDLDGTYVVDVATAEVTVIHDARSGAVPQWQPGE